MKVETERAGGDIINNDIIYTVCQQAKNKPDILVFPRDSNECMLTDTKTFMFEKDH